MTSIRTSSSTTDLAQYKESVLALARSIVVYLPIITDQEDSYFATRYAGYKAQDIHADKRYVLNLQGKRHPIVDPVLMIPDYANDKSKRMISLDITTLSEDANKELHILIKESSAVQADITALHPTQHNFIQRVINPIPLEVITSASTGNILFYDKSLVEPNEINLINDLEKLIQQFINRWFLHDYMLSDEYYLGAFIATLRSAIPLFIYTLRDDRRNTNEANLIHIKLYLQSHGLFDKYRDRVPLNKLLFLYNNLPYIKKHAGHDKTFSLIMNNLFKDNDTSVNVIDVTRSTVLGKEQPFTDLRVENTQTHKVRNESLESYYGNLRVASTNDDLYVKEMGELDYIPKNTVRSKLLSSMSISPVTQHDIVADFIAGVIYQSAFIDKISYVIPDATALLPKHNIILITDLLLYRGLLVSKINDTYPTKLPAKLSVPRGYIHPLHVPDKLEHMRIQDKKLIDSVLTMDSLLFNATSDKLGVLRSYIRRTIPLLQNMLNQISSIEDPHRRADSLKYLRYVIKTDIVTVSDEPLVSEWLESKHLTVDLTAEVSTHVIQQTLTTVSGMVSSVADVKENVMLDILSSLSSYNIKAYNTPSSVMVHGLDYSHLRILKHSDDKVTLLEVKPAKHKYVKGEIHNVACYGAPVDFLACITRQQIMFEKYLTQFDREPCSDPMETLRKLGSTHKAIADDINNIAVQGNC